MATASILALLGRSRFQKGFSASTPSPSPTKTTAPLSRSMTTPPRLGLQLVPDVVKAHLAQGGRYWDS